MEEAPEPLPVEGKLLIGFHRPGAVPAAVEAAPVQDIVPVPGPGGDSGSVNQGAGQGVPGADPLFTEAEAEEVPPLPAVCQGRLPGPAEEPPAPLRVRGEDRGAAELFPAEDAERPEKLPVPVFLRSSQRGEGPVLFQKLRVRALPGELRREIPEHRVLQHPAPQIPPHPGVSEARVQVSRLKLPQLLQNLLRGAGAHAVQELVEIEIGRRVGNRLPVPPAQPRPPGEVPPELPETQVVIGRKIAEEVSLPGQIVLIVLHEAGLPVEVLCPGFLGLPAVFVEPLHLPEACRDRLQLRAAGTPREGQGGLGIE